jgi:putative transposase
MEIFSRDSDYMGFERVLREACERGGIKLLAYCIMPSHWHMVIWPLANGDLSSFLSWLTMTHAQRWHASHHTAGSGHLYQGRFKSFPVETDEHFLTVCRYVERNPLRANLVSQAQNWRWCSLWHRVHCDQIGYGLLSEWPVPCPANWVSWVNEPQTGEELRAIRLSVNRGRPYGKEVWQKEMAKKLGLGATLRVRGRPKSIRYDTDRSGS